jgi:putative addiction module component (TIGR02574 family)
MPQPVPLPPPGFDELSTDEKVSYVQSLWDRIAADQDEVPVPDWHREVFRRRLHERDAYPEDTLGWEEMRDQLRRELENREPEG